MTAAACVVLAASAGPVLAKKTQLDDGLFTTYSSNTTTISYLVCGSLPQSSGCFSSGSLGTFEQACAVLQGTPMQKGDVITRSIYVLDKRTSASDPIQLYVFKRTDTITDTFDTVQVKQTKKISLNLTGGASSHCSMAGNNGFVYAATDVDTTVAAVDKKAFTVTQTGGFSPPATVQSITADDRGYVTLHFQSGYYLYDPNGNLEQDGGGAADLINTRNAWRP